MMSVLNRHDPSVLNIDVAHARAPVSIIGEHPLLLNSGRGSGSVRRIGVAPRKFHFSRRHADRDASVNNILPELGADGIRTHGDYMCTHPALIGFKIGGNLGGSASSEQGQGKESAEHGRSAVEVDAEHIYASSPGKVASPDSRAFEDVLGVNRPSARVYYPWGLGRRSEKQFPDCLTPPLHQERPATGGEVMQGKACTKCGVFYNDASANFYRNKSSFRPWCKSCSQTASKDYKARNQEQIAAKEKEYRQEYVAKNRDRIAAQKKEYNQRNAERLKDRRKEKYQANRAAVLEQMANRYQANRTRIIAHVKRYYAEHADERREYQARYKHEHPERVRVHERRRRARKLLSRGSHTEADVRRQHDAQKGLCYWCQVAIGTDYEVDHVIPVSKGGDDSPANIVIACAPCNRRKGAQMPSEFAGVLL